MAYEALLAVDRDGRQSHLVIRDMLREAENSSAESGSSAKNGDSTKNGSAGEGDGSAAVRDKAFFLRLVEGTLEYRLQLDYVIGLYSRMKINKMRPGIREILRMGVYQIFYMDSVPDHAAVNEAVSLAVRKGFAGLRGFVNGVLRTAAREKDHIRWPERKTDLVRALSVKYSISENILEAWLPRFGEEKTEAICRSFLEDRPLAVHRFTSRDRTPAVQCAVSADRTLAVTRAASMDRPGFDVQGDFLIPAEFPEGAFFLKKGIDPAGIPDFREGSLYVQDLSSQIAIAAAGICPGDRVLDLCAAPGGKSLLAAERGAQVLSRDLTEEKTALIRQNAERLGFLKDERDESVLIQQNMKQLDFLNTERGGSILKDGAGVTGIMVETADAAVFDPLLEAVFDVVIADLPCSGFGVCGRKPEIKYKSYLDTVTELARIQRTILVNAVRYVRPGGKLLYSTCTIAEEENESNVRWLLKTCSDFQPAELDEAVCRLLQNHEIPSGRYGVQLLPCDGPWDGFFFALFHRMS